MVNWLGFFALAFVWTTLLRVDRLVWGTHLTPGVVLIGGYTIIAGIYALASEFYEMAPIIAQTYWILFFFGVLTLVSSVSVAFAFKWQRKSMSLPKPSTGIRTRGMLILFALFFIGIIWGPAQSAGGFWSSESKEVLGGGIYGHSHILLAFLTIFYSVSTIDRATLRYPIVVACVVALSLYPVKGWTLIPVLAIAFNEFLRKKDKQAGILPLFVASLVGVIVFFGIYLARADFGNVSFEVVNSVLDEIFKHFLFYLTSGFAGLNAVVSGLRLQGGIEVLLAPFVNIFNLLAGKPYVDIISDVYVEGLLDHGDGGNVYSFLGALISRLDWIGGVGLALLIVILSYVIFSFAIRTRTAAAMVCVLYMLAILSFSWFEYYFWHLTVYEIGIISFVVMVIEYSTKRRL